MNAREDQTDSHATIKNSCCCSQDATATVPRNVRISSTNMPRLSTVSTPKKACKHTKDGVYIAKVMYVTKGKYIEYAKDGMYVADSEHSMPYGMYLAQGKYGEYVKGEMIPIEQ